MKDKDLINGFKDIRIVDNFYQTSSFFPMPTTLISTLSTDGETNLGGILALFSILYCG